MASMEPKESPPTPAVVPPPFLVDFAAKLAELHAFHFAIRPGRESDIGGRGAFVAELGFYYGPTIATCMLTRTVSGGNEAEVWATMIAEAESIRAANPEA